MKNWLAGWNQSTREAQMATRDPDGVGALDKILIYIRNSNLKAGDRLPSERDLAYRLGMSRNKVRIALNELAARRRLRRHVGQGTFLSDAEIWPSEFSLSVSEVTSPLEVFEVRLAIEPAAAKNAARRGSLRDLREIEAIWTNGRDARTYAEKQAINGDLHLAIARASRNRLFVDLQRVILTIMDVTHWGRLVPQTDEAHLASTWESHEELVEAIIKRDANRAAQLSRNHITEVLKIVSIEA
jgi:DNA-binding FadR family transcriptional regulator